MSRKSERKPEERVEAVLSLLRREEPAEALAPTPPLFRVRLGAAPSRSIDQKITGSDAMPYETGERLKSFLDTNQLHREQMCQAILALDKRFSEVRPRQPYGGPDGGRDIEAIFDGTQRAFAAVGFITQADDSGPKKRRLKSKFADDLERAAGANPAPNAFFFLTNMALTVGDKDKMTQLARKRGFAYAEVFDRESLRIALDAADGLAARYQYLRIPLSDAEQASFFARWGNDIQSLVATGFQTVQSTLDRLLFLQESGQPLATVTLSLELDDTYRAEQIGHFRAFCRLIMIRPGHHILFGSSDIFDRMRPDRRHDTRLGTPGIKSGISSGQWEHNYFSEEEQGEEEYKLTRVSSSIGLDAVACIDLHYTKSKWTMSIPPQLALLDLNQALFVVLANSALAAKARRIHLYGNEYKLAEIGRADFQIEDYSPTPTDIPIEFSAGELLDPWVRIRPNVASAFGLSFSEETPVRLFSPSKTKISRGENGPP
jgi:hypothetical protein